MTKIQFELDTENNRISFPMKQLSLLMSLISPQNNVDVDLPKVEFKPNPDQFKVGDIIEIETTEGFLWAAEITEINDYVYSFKGTETTVLFFRNDSSWWLFYPLVEEKPLKFFSQYNAKVEKLKPALSKDIKFEIGDIVEIRDLEDQPFLLKVRAFYDDSYHFEGPLNIQIFFCVEYNSWVVGWFNGEEYLASFADSHKVNLLRHDC